MRAIWILAVPLVASAASANDTMAELRAGGLSFTQSFAVEMQREDLYISAGEIRVDYVFHNTTDTDVETVVAFPMPDLTGNPYIPSPIARDQDDNFLDFTVTVDGAAVTPQLQQRAIANTLDVTDELTARNIPLMPNGEATFAALEALPLDLLQGWQDRGLVLLEEYDSGQGMSLHPGAAWTLKSSFYWTMSFPAGAEVRVSHRYTPAAGASFGAGFLDWEGAQRSEYFAEYQAAYCIDDAFERAAKAMIQRQQATDTFAVERQIGYVLTTGANWAGPIGEFHLTIDKGAEENLVSFCGEGVAKTGPTTFELTYRDFTPRQDLRVLLLQAPH